MFQDILNIHEDCHESFIDFSQIAGDGDRFIACAGLSILKTEYVVGKSGAGEYFLSEPEKRTHVHYLLATKSGQGKLTLPSGEFIIEPNTIVILPASTPFIYQLDSQEWQTCWMLLHDCERFNFINQLSAEVFASAEGPLIYQTMNMLAQQAIHESANKAAIEVRLVEILLYQIEQALNKDQNLTQQQLRFKQLMQGVYKQLNYPWSVELLANKMHLSEPQFFRLCQKETGLSPMKLLTKARLEYACYLLRYTNYNLEQIASSIGYADAAAFAHRFKKSFGLAPGMWRVQTV